MNQRIIVKNTDGSIGIIIPTGEISIEDVVKKDVPKGLTAEIVSVNKIPADRTFRNGWKFDKVKKIGFDITKCKEITHDRRRVARGLEFAPHDDVIMRQIPGADNAAAETARAVIRGKYDDIQVAIDACSDEVGLKAIIDVEGI
jgi:hypothetical protein